MFPTLELAPIRMYLTMFANTLRPSIVPLAAPGGPSQDQICRPLGIVGAGIRRDADVRRSEGGSVVDSGAYDSDDLPRRTRMTRSFCAGKWRTISADFSAASACSASDIFSTLPLSSVGRAISLP
jgi:hypothetical protein